ncbi:MAG: alpha/beta hydrolase fold domain-containing protein [Pseudomonadales bacterium]
MTTPSLSPWANGHSIEVLRSVSAGLQADVQDYEATPVNADGVAAEWVLANGVSTTAPVVAYFHGGAYLCGTPQQYRNATVWLSRLARVRVLAVDYALAPEHPHPSAFENALSVYQWLLAQLPTPAKIILAGDSAGASIAITLAADALALGLPLPAALLTNSPFADLALASASLDDPALNENEPNKTTIQWLAKTYLQAGPGPGLDACDPRHSPIYRDLTGLPPLLIQTAGKDNLRDDGIRLARKARECGVTTVHTDYARSGHIWIVTEPADKSPHSLQALQEMVTFANGVL